MTQIKSKRTRILDAAYELFINKGYWDTKIIDISEAAGIGKGTVYEYFQSKDAIFLELFKTKVEAGYDNITDLISKNVSPEKKLKEFIDTELENTSKFTFNKYFLIDLVVKSDAFRNPELIRSIQKLMSKKFSILFQIIEEGIDKGEFLKIDPLLATASILGAINFYISFDLFPIDLEDIVPTGKTKPWSEDQFLDLLLNGLKT
ncbi:MAG: TetR/AcrR family transcriptional regulator [Eubacteriales bacterium]|nr:TetR/AcrR family transcriptional regulator [Eubacteriales bacterium]